MWRTASEAPSPFAHASTPIPSRDLAPTRSGHYLLIVHEAGDRDAVVLMRRLVVYERMSTVDIAFRRPMDAAKVPTHQRLEVEVELPPDTAGPIPCTTSGCPSCRM